MQKSNNVIGLDIGTSSIKLIEIEESKGGYRLKNFGINSLPKDAIVNGSIVNHDAVVNSIQQILSNLKIKTKDVVASISGHPVIIKKITMPLATDEELEDSIKFEAEQYIPFDLEEVNIDFQVLNVEGFSEVLPQIVRGASLQGTQITHHRLDTVRVISTGELFGLALAPLNHRDGAIINRKIFVDFQHLNCFILAFF